MGVIKVSDSRASVGNAIRYITKKEKTEVRLISGYNCNPKTAILEMQDTKNAWRKTGGRQCKHIIQSFSKDEAITPQEAHSIATEFVQTCPLLQGFEICYATHKDREHMHTHYIINSVSFETGKKFHQSKRDLQALKDFSDGILLAHGKSICEKNSEITTSKMETYRSIEKAVQGTYKSWMYDTMVAVDIAMKAAADKNNFIILLAEKGYTVDWRDNRKYITFTNSDGKKVRNNTLSKIFKIPIGKEDILHEISRNATSRGYSVAKTNILRTDKREPACVGERRTQGTVAEIRRKLDGISNIGELELGDASADDRSQVEYAGNEQRHSSRQHGQKPARVHRSTDLSR